MAGFRRNVEIEGYILEPKYTEEELRQMNLGVVQGGGEDAIGGDGEDADDEALRVGHTDWCRPTCDRCVMMPTEKESLCCNEDAANVVEKLHEHYMECITEHSDFTSVCLTPAVLRVMMHCLREIRGYGQQHEWENSRTYRLVAYRAYTFWVHQWLGKRNRKVIPASVVNAIRQQFPSPDGQYEGFKDVEDTWGL